MVGLIVILKCFDFFEDRPKNDSVEAYEQYVFVTICVLKQFFGEYTAKQIARAACRCWAPLDASTAKQLAAARRLDPDQKKNLAGCNDLMIFKSIPIWDYSMVGCMLKDKVTPEQLRTHAHNIRAYQANHKLRQGVYASPKVYKELCN